MWLADVDWLVGSRCKSESVRIYTCQRCLKNNLIWTLIFRVRLSSSSSSTIPFTTLFLPLSLDSIFLENHSPWATTSSTIRRSSRSVIDLPPHRCRIDPDYTWLRFRQSRWERVLRSPSPCNARPFVRTGTSLSRVRFSDAGRKLFVTDVRFAEQAARARSSTCPPPRPASTDTRRCISSPLMYVSSYAR